MYHMPKGLSQETIERIESVGGFKYLVSKTAKDAIRMQSKSLAEAQVEGWGLSDQDAVILENELEHCLGVYSDVDMN